MVFIIGIIRLLGRNSIYLSSAFRSQSRYYHKTGVISLFFFLSLCFLRGLFCSMGEKMTQTKKNSNIKSRHIRVNCVHFSTRSRHIAAKQSWRLLPVVTIGPHKFGNASNYLFLQIVNSTLFLVCQLGSELRGLTGFRSTPDC